MVKVAAVACFSLFTFRFSLLISSFSSHIMRIRQRLDLWIGTEYDENVSFFKNGIGLDDTFGNIDDFIDAQQVLFDALADDGNDVQVEIFAQINFLHGFANKRRR